MATYQILKDINFYNSGWDKFSLGSTATGGPFAGVNNTDWRTILGVTITPAANEKVTSFTLNVGFIKQYSEYGNNMKFGGYLYTSLDTAKNVSGPPSGYIAHFEESTATYTSYSGRMVDMTFSGLNITDTTTLYIWFYVTPSQYCQIWTSKSGNVVAPTITLTTAILTSACTPPASVSASGIVKPNGSFTVSWKEAGKGTGNSINGYRIYYRVSSNGAAPTTSTYTGYKDVSSTATSGSTTITLSNATRGYKVVCGVVTKGTAGSSYWSSIKTGGSVTINSLPAAPSVSIDKTIVPSSGGTVTFTVNAGADSNSGQTRTVWYSTSSTGTKKEVSSGTLSTTTPGTYYFWTSDGLEYSSSYTSKSFSKNTAPKIESLSLTPTKYTANGNDNSYTNFLGLTYALNKSSGTLYTYIKVGDNIVKTITTTVSSTLTKVNLNINEYLAKYYNQATLNYKVYGIFNDGIENSADSSISEYTLSAPPAITKWGNGLEESTDATDFYFNKNLTIYYDEDTEITSRTIASNLGEISNAKYYSDRVVFDLINYTGGGDVKFTLNFYNGYFNKTSAITLKQISPVILKNPSISETYIDYFSTGSTAINLNCGWPFTDAIGKEYGFNGLTNTNTLAIIEYGGKTSSISGTVTKEGDFLQIAFSEENLRIYDAALSEAYLGKHDFNINLQVTNRFGDKINSESLTITINYNTNPIWTSFTSNCNDTNKIQEDKELIFTLNFSTYTQENVKASIYIDRTGSELEDDRDYVLYDEIIFSNLGYNDNPKNSRQRNFIIPEIADSNNRAFYCILTGQSSGLSVRSDTLNIPVLRHTTPQNFSFTKVTPTSEGGTVEYTLDDLGYDEGTYELKITNTQDDNYKDIKNNSWIGGLTSTTYQLVLSTKVKDKIKTFYSNILLYFTDVPTVSYRKNLIGINFDGIDEIENNNSLVMISQYDNKKDITFYGYNEGVLAKRTIDLSTGALSGFIIDGGSW